MTRNDDGRAPALAPEAGSGKGGKAAKPAKTRIYEIAKEYSVSSEAMLGIVRGLGVEAKSHMSSIAPETVEKVRKEFDRKKEAVKEDFARKREVDRKARKRAREQKAPAVAVSPPGETKSADVKPEAKPAGSPSGGPRRKSRGDAPRRQVDQKVVRANIRKTFADMDKGKRRYRKRSRDDGEEVTEDTTVLRLTEFVSTAEFANSMDVSPSQIIAKAMEMGSMVTINQRLDRDMMEMLADEFGFSINFESVLDEDPFEAAEEEVDEADLQPRPPVVTIMGHVDHGKTSLLDYVRETNVIGGEAGGITQHIGAYHVELDAGVITFLDTPGHEAFTAMRARGAQVTDIVILVVAADDSVMPQTVEAIDHAKAAGVPILVAVNKIDKPGSKPDQVRQELTGRGITPEEWGGENIVVDVSAKTGEGIEKLLEMVLLQAEVMELKANPARAAKGAIIEAQKEKGRGTVVTALVQDGTLRVGDPVVAGTQAGRVRALTDERGRRLQSAGPGTPVGIMGFHDVPRAGEGFVVLKTDREAREIATRRTQLQREQEVRYHRHTTLENLFDQVRDGETQELRVVIKADVEGSVGAFADALEKISTDEVKVRVMHRAVGNVNESDILLAAASDAIVLSFHIDVDPRATEAQKREGVDLRHYDVIYEAVADVRAAMEGMLKPEIQRRSLGSAEVRQVFKVPKLGAIAGSMVTNGEVRRNAIVKVLREGDVLHESRVASLRRFKDDVSEVKNGFECGIGVEGFGTLKEGDVLEFFEEVEVARRLT